MSKKKSYMDMDNILSEGFYKKIIHLTLSILKVYLNIGQAFL